MSTTPRADRLDFNEASNFDVPWSDEYRALETELTLTQSQLKEALEKGDRLQQVIEHMLGKPWDTGCVWVCESHPHLLWPHDDCPGPGTPPVVIAALAEKVVN